MNQATAWQQARALCVELLLVVCVAAPGLKTKLARGHDIALLTLLPTVLNL